MSVWAELVLRTAQISNRTAWKAIAIAVKTAKIKRLLIYAFRIGRPIAYALDISYLWFETTGMAKALK
jgi:hypothetical protein